MIKSAQFISFLFIFLGIAFIVTQIALPVFSGTPFFPFLRTRPKEALKNLAQAREDKEVSDIEAEAASITSSKSKNKNRS